MQQKGFTLIEFTIGMAIIAILIGVSAPSIVTFFANSELRAASSSLFSDLGSARAEALRTRRAVTICAGNQSTGCSGSWANGWMVYQDLNSSGNYDSGDRLIREETDLPKQISFTGPNDFVFRSTGTVGVTGTIQIRHPKATSGRDLQVIQGGRVISAVVNP